MSRLDELLRAFIGQNRMKLLATMPAVIELFWATRIALSERAVNYSLVRTARLSTVDAKHAKGSGIGR